MTNSEKIEILFNEKRTSFLIRFLKKIIGSFITSLIFIIIYNKSNDLSWIYLLIAIIIFTIQTLLNRYYNKILIYKIVIRDKSLIINYLEFNQKNEIKIKLSELDILIDYQGIDFYSRTYKIFFRKKRESILKQYCVGAWNKDIMLKLEKVINQKKKSK